MSKLATEYHGFLKFIRRANQEVVSWFGPHCNYDPVRIALMAAREWDCMADSERQYFIKANRADSRQGETGTSSGSRPFLCYLLHKRHINFPGSTRATSNGIVNQSLFHPHYVRVNGHNWRAMPKTERDKYAKMNLAEMSIDHVLEKREKLHQMFDPKELSILEFILKTKPKKPNCARAWFNNMECLRVSSPESKDRWLSLSQEDRRFYDVCSSLDKKRFQFEKNAWITKLLSTDLEKDDLTLDDFESIRAKSNIETIGSLIEMNKNLLPACDRPKRPLTPFSLFVRDYRYQIRDKKPEFRFGQHLKETSEAWSKLTIEERQFYKDISNELRESFNESMKSYSSDGGASDKEICNFLFNHAKSITGPSRPSHLIVRVPSVVNIYGKAMNIKKMDRKKSWESLSDAAKEPYIREHEELRMKSDNMKEQMKVKLKYIVKLIAKSEELARFKREVHLLRARNRAIKGIYE